MNRHEHVRCRRGWRMNLKRLMTPRARRIPRYVADDVPGHRRILHVAMLSRPWTASSEPSQQLESSSHQVNFMSTLCSTQTYWYRADRRVTQCSSRMLLVLVVVAIACRRALNAPTLLHCRSRRKAWERVMPHLRGQISRYCSCIDCGWTIPPRCSWRATRSHILPWSCLRLKLLSNLAKVISVISPLASCAKVRLTTPDVVFARVLLLAAQMARSAVDVI